MNHNITKDDLQQVLVSKGSRVFHFRGPSRMLGGLTNKPMCAMKNKSVVDHDNRVEDINNAAKMSRRHCKDCAKLAYDLYDIEVYMCYTCEDLNLLNDKEYVEVSKQDRDDIGNTLHLCENCVDLINEKMSTE